MIVHTLLGINCILYIFSKFNLKRYSGVSLIHVLTHLDTEYDHRNIPLKRYFLKFLLILIIIATIQNNDKY